MRQESERATTNDNDVVLSLCCSEHANNERRVAFAPKDFTYLGLLLLSQNYTMHSSDRRVSRMDCVRVMFQMSSTTPAPTPTPDDNGCVATAGCATENNDLLQPATHSFAWIDTSYCTSTRYSRGNRENTTHYSHERK